MDDYYIKTRIEYLEKQIRLCKEDMELLESCRAEPEAQGYDGFLHVWANMKKKLDDYVEELVELKNNQLKNRGEMTQ